MIEVLGAYRYSSAQRGMLEYKYIADTTFGWEY